MPPPASNRPGQGHADPNPPEKTPSPPAIMTSADILRGQRETLILHGGEAYRLRVTSKDRLILTK